MTPMPKSHTITRLDFTTDVRCHFCPRLLTKGTAYFVAPKDGAAAGAADARPAGPVCAKRHADAPETGVPNFTRGAPETPPEEHDQEQEGREETLASGDDPQDAADEARRHYRRMPRTTESALLEYLLLRTEKLAALGFEPTEKMRRAHARYRSAGRLSEADLRYLGNALAVIHRDHPELSPANLQKCYAVAFWIQRLSQEEPRERFPKAMLANLSYHKRLTPDQVSAINRWFENRQGYPAFDPHLFGDAPSPL